MMYATYSPEDNKLRLYSTKRLDAEEYARVKAEGFRWAPKQELFVAPMWTPSREDLLVELCGEIGDEDTSLVERQEARAKRFEDYSESRAKDAQNAYETSVSIAKRFEGGQPILVGHHSEKRARKDKERIDGAMRAAVKMWDTSKYWTDRAQGAIRHAKYKERPDVRARRIKTLEADQRKCQRSKDASEKALKIWTLLHDDTLSGIKKKDGAPTTFAERALFVAGHSNTASHGTYSGLRDGTMTPEEAQAQTIAMNERAKAHSERWIAHYANRIAYERAMLDEAGGTLEQQKGCETGGAVRCWASPRGGWSYIQKVNKVTVTVLDNWGNGGRNFTRTIEFDQLAGIMTAAEVQAKRDAGVLVEEASGLGFRLLDPEAALRKMYTEKGMPKEQQDAIIADVDAKAKPEFLEKMRETLKNGGVSVVVAPQLFPTPPDLAARMVELAEIQPGDRVLEPSAGTGALIGAMGGRMFGHNPERGELMAVEINVSLAQHIEREFPLTNVATADFLECGRHNLGTFDAILMNPPFGAASDIKHITHALTFLRSGGRLVAICANGPRQNDKLKPLTLDGGSWEDLPDGTFSEAGTNVRTALITLTVPEEEGETQPDAQESLEPPIEREEPAFQPEPVIERVSGGSQYRLFL